MNTIQSDAARIACLAGSIQTLIDPLAETLHGPEAEAYVEAINSIAESIHKAADDMGRTTGGDALQDTPPNVVSLAQGGIQDRRPDIRPSWYSFNLQDEIDDLALTDSLAQCFRDLIALGSLLQHAGADPDLTITGEVIS